MPHNGTPSALQMEFLISRAARDRYQLDESLFSISGDIIFANFHAARQFAQRMNQRRDLVKFPEQAVRASQINALGLIHEITHYAFRSYREQHNRHMLKQALGWLYDKVGQTEVEATLLKFIDEFPPPAVYRREMTREAYLERETAGLPNREAVLEELLMLWLANINPAFGPFQELFDDTPLEKETAYATLIASLHTFFGARPVIGWIAGFGDGDGTGGQSLIDILRAPARLAPHSLEGQLRFLQERWGLLLGRYVYRLFGSLDLIKEEERPIFLGPGPVEVPVYELAALEAEPERFSPDREWMPRLVMIAKNAYVWLDQLSKTHGRPIATLDQLPDEELDALARRGITGLWLIGLWERSAASRRIKQIMGNPDAVASAYSLFDYQIAAKLGGEAAYQQLRERAWQRGIRLASDMVPNHVGVDGRWVIEHPDWFISLDYSPFPVYTFNGPDLSWDERVGLFIEDHYYDRSDAAVVFKRVDRRTGGEQYIYHGNDGTNMAWNDTAQLNYLNPAVREGVIQTILHVARQFPVIRFDAAMTLAKRHFQRLWFPEPGAGGAIPSRAEHGLTKAQFDAAMPQEFWREVVDRVAAEAPDTLLLAEAFWLMEGYFVRTLGMHRVYNSAFMVLLRDEDNAKYRSLMKNTLEFDPEILKRYVNFVNNPDERTAVDQFGKGDKYFGVCTLMVTMPGLPMFGHGQIEGFTEKYGMEYQRAYWDEQPDEYLVQRHEHEIFPLLQRRYLFAGVEDFLLYDFYMSDGQVNEDVFAYSNRFGDERALVVYHNRDAEIRGWIRASAAYSVKTGQGDERALVQKDLGTGLGLHDDSGRFCIFRDQTTGLEYIRNSKDLFDRGMYIELGAYKCHVFVDVREVRDNAWHQYADLAAYLDGRGVPSIEAGLKELFLQPIHQPFKELANAAMFRRLFEARVAAPAQQLDAELLDEVERKMAALLHGIKEFTGSAGDEVAVAQEVRRSLEAVLQLTIIQARFPADGAGAGPTQAIEPSEPADADAAPADAGPAGSLARRAGQPGEPEDDLEQAEAGTPAISDYEAAIDMVQAGLIDDLALWSRLFGWVFVHELGKIGGAADYDEQSRSWVDEWLLGRIIASALREVGLDEAAAARAVIIIKRLTSHQRWFEAQDVEGTYRVLEELLGDSELQQLLGVNRYQGLLWFNKQSFERLLWWLLLLAAVIISADPLRTPDAVAEQIAACYRTVRRLQEAAEESGYQVEKLLELVQEPVDEA